MAAPTHLHPLAWAVVAVGVLAGGWLAFDGARALVTGDDVTPASGPHAGRLGPWASVVSAAGVDPRSTAMKVAHVTLGAAWLAAAVAFAVAAPWAWWGMLACAVATLWYLPFGTVLGLVEIVLLLLPALRAPH